MPEDYNIADQERMSRAANYFAWLSRLIVPELGRRVIEVGCGIGNFTAALLNHDAVFALDPEAACVERLKQRYPNQPNLHPLVTTPGTPEFDELARLHPDSCVCLNVLEHIEDHHRALHDMALVLPAGGVIVLLVPAFEALYGPIDRNLSHFRRYSRESLGALARANRLQIVKMRYVNIAGFFGWWLNSHLLRREAQSPTQIAIFDRCVVPWLSRLEAMAPPPFGQSLFAVLRKP